MAHKHSLALAFLISFLASSTTFALDYFAGLSFSVSRGTSAVPSQPEIPQVNLYGAGINFGIRSFNFLLLGVRGSYSQIDQISDPTFATGNRRGTRLMPVAPLIGFRLSSVRMLTEYQFMGDYALANTDFLSRDITYKKPLGYAFEILYDLSPRMAVGLRYENVDFYQEQVGSSTPVDLPDKLSLKSYGVAFDVHF